MPYIRASSSRTMVSCGGHQCCQLSKLCVVSHITQVVSNAHVVIFCPLKAMESEIQYSVREQRTIGLVRRLRKCFHDVTHQRLTRSFARFQSVGRSPPMPFFLFVLILHVKLLRLFQLACVYSKAWDRGLAHTVCGCLDFVSVIHIRNLCLETLSCSSFGRT